LLAVLVIIAAIFLSNSVTGPLRILQDRLASVKLGSKNEAIQWKSRDEIGALIDEYNGMLAELSASAEKLAKSERESAWREMAKQVAHEIKNPLTPMKLNTQMLKRAWEDKAPGFEERLNRYAQNLIEQIDTLSHIALVVQQEGVISMYIYTYYYLCAQCVMRVCPTDPRSNSVSAKASELKIELHRENKEG
jgi:nitrogen fixation/metabolism regulation signal transduction histidine kinase